MLRDVATRAEEFGVGLVYEDCSFHPVFCTSYSAEEDELQGVSLIDGTWPRSCSPTYCGPRPLRADQVLWIKSNFSAYVAAR
jgi:hypothetical protein